jgi:iron complex transport system ATP-binding protein
MTAGARLSAERIAFGYARGVDILRDVTLAVAPGEVLFVLGANGSGKTTLLNCLAGLRAPQAGRVFLGGRPIDRLSPRERARELGLVPQLHEPVFDYTVGEIVLMGRAPHLGLFARPGREDRRAAARALEAVNLESLRDRIYTEISGGERQLVLIARGLAQGAACLLMDEPAAHLDPHHQELVFDAVLRLARAGCSFAVSSHQPNSALLYADRVALLVDGRLDRQGRPAETLTEDALRATYGMEFETIRGESGSRAILPRLRGG